MAVTSNNLETRYREKDEDEVILACQNGDVQAYEFLVNRYQKQMFNIAFRMTGSYEEACEVVQEAFLSAYRSIKKYRKEARFSTWLYSITVNQTRSRLKEMRSHDFHEGVSIDDPPEDEKDSVPVNNTPPIRWALSNRWNRRKSKRRCRNALTPWMMSTGRLWCSEIFRDFPTMKSLRC